MQFLVRNQEQADEINNEKTNKKVDDSIQWNDNVSATTDIEKALQGTKYILLCIPAQVLPNYLEENFDKFPADLCFVNCSKGIKKDFTLIGMIIKEGRFLNVKFKEMFKDMSRYVVLSGPSFASEMFQKMPTMCTIASSNDELLIEYFFFF